LNALALVKFAFVRLFDIEVAFVAMALVIGAAARSVFNTALEAAEVGGGTWLGAERNVLHSLGHRAAFWTAVWLAVDFGHNFEQMRITFANAAGAGIMIYDRDAVTSARLPCVSSVAFACADVNCAIAVGVISA
jgi:hypothetical protein